MGNQPKAAVPKDRDVRAALRGLDYCALLASAGATGLDARPGPFACDGELGPRRERVTIRITGLDSAARLRTPARDLAGAKAYVPDEPAGCTVHLPVSFALALTVGSLDIPCRRLEPATAKVVTALADPAASRTDPGWDACGVPPATTAARLPTSRTTRCGPAGRATTCGSRCSTTSRTPAGGRPSPAPRRRSTRSARAAG